MSDDKRRLPPGQHETTKLPVLDLGEQPNLATSDWTLSVAGLVENPIRWMWRDFMSQPQTDRIADIHCVTAWSRFGSRWSGVLAPSAPQGEGEEKKPRTVTGAGFSFCGRPYFLGMP